MLRAIFLALFFSLLFGLVVGTVLRLRLQRPTWYLGGVSAPVAVPALPLDVRNAGPGVLDARHYEEQVG